MRRKTILNGFRYALAIFSGKIIFNRAMPERLRTLRHCIFTEGSQPKLHLQRRFLRKRGGGGKFLQTFSRAELPQSSLTVFDSSLGGSLWHGEKVSD